MAYEEDVPDLKLFRVLFVLETLKLQVYCKI